MKFAGKKIILGVTGSIAAYKAVYLLRMLVEEGAEVDVVMTEEAVRFISPLTFRTLSGKPVHTDLFDLAPGEEITHLYLGRGADMIVVAPATANIIGKMANGIADDLLSTILMAGRCPVMIVPAMDTEMYQNPVVQKNIDYLHQLNVKFVGPVSGPLASGISGRGRMSEPEEILSCIEDELEENKEFTNQVIMVTAGPTRENLDPVRYLSNISSGKMGYAIARAAKKRAGKVILISGPSALTIPSGVEYIPVTSSEEMCSAVMNRLSETTVVIMAAAVSDFMPSERSESKIKKKDSMDLKLIKTRDVLEEIRKKKANQFIVGFAAETDDLMTNAGKKLESKDMDMIVANDVSNPNAGFEKDTNIVTLMDRWGKVIQYPVMTKPDVADRILDHVAFRMGLKKYE